MNNRNDPAIFGNLTRSDIIGVLEDNDANGCYSDADSELEYGFTLSNYDLIVCAVDQKLTTAYAIQTEFIYGWDYVGTIDDKDRDLYATEKEAQTEIASLVKSMDYDADEWRVVVYVPADDDKTDFA